MLVYYAMGGGMGHLMRAAAFLHTYRIKDYLVLTSSQYADVVFEPNQLIRVDPALENSPEGLFSSIVNTLKDTGCEILIMDCFPNGILGEFTGKKIPVAEVWHITRRMKWDQYRDKVLSSPHFDRSIVLEELEPLHRQFIVKHSDTVEDGRLAYPHVWVHPQFQQRLTFRPTWLIVHAGKAQELQLLIDHALDMLSGIDEKPEILLISPINHEHESIAQLHFYPAYALFPYAERIFTGCGFNSMQQTLDYRNKHVFIPFERKYDDQHWRAAEAKKKP